jgi:hypothetical protein
MVEDVVYLGLGVLLAGSAIALLISSGNSFVQNLLARSLTTNIVPLLDRLLLILLIVELHKRGETTVAERNLNPIRESRLKWNHL